MASRSTTKSAALEDDNTEAKAPKKKAKAEPAAPQETEQQLRNKLRNEAQTEILNKYRSEFNDLASKKFEANGLKFNRRLNDKERAAKKVQDLLEKYPELRNQFKPGEIPGEDGYDEHGDVPEEAPDEHEEGYPDDEYSEQYRG